MSILFIAFYTCLRGLMSELWAGCLGALMPPSSPTTPFTSSPSTLLPAFLFSLFFFLGKKRKGVSASEAAQGFSLGPR